MKSFLNQPEGVIPPKQAHWLTTNVKNRIKMEKDTRAFDWKCLRGTCTLQEQTPPWTQRHDAAIVSELSGESEVLGQSASTQYLFCTLWRIHHDTRDCYLCIRRVRGPMGAALTSAEIVPGWIHGNMNLHW